MARGLVLGMGRVVAMLSFSSASSQGGKACRTVILCQRNRLACEGCHFEFDSSVTECGNKVGGGGGGWSKG